MITFNIEFKSGNARALRHLIRTLDLLDPYASILRTIQSTTLTEEEVRTVLGDEDDETVKITAIKRKKS